MYQVLTSDRSFKTYLSTDTPPTTGFDNGAIYLEVDTGVWYVFHEGSWYAQ